MNVKIEYHGSDKVLIVLDQVKEIANVLKPEFVHIVVDMEVRD